VKYVSFQTENQLDSIIHLIEKDLSEPYSVFTYRYFIHNWPELCIMAEVDSKIVGAIICKAEVHKRGPLRGYIAMLAVDPQHRHKGIGSALVSFAINKMVEKNCEEAVLETEITNLSALSLYGRLGFVKDKRLKKYYLNGVDAFRFKLWLS